MEQEANKDYIKGYNEGYIIAEVMPELSEQLSAAIGNSERSQGFKDGRMQCLFEQTKIKYPAWLKNEHTEVYQDKDVSKDKDKE